MSKPDLSDLMPFRRFAAEVWEPQKLGSENSLRWLLRYRQKNGLLSSGAVVELRTPGATRPRLFINRPRFAEWMAGGAA